jgi:hypothetical protein
MKYLQASDVVAELDEALRYKTEEREFNLDFSLTLSFLPQGHCVNLTSKKKCSIHSPWGVKKAVV